MNGKEISQLIVEWANKNHIHPDDFDNLFVSELMEMLESSKWNHDFKGVRIWIII